MSITTAIARLEHRLEAVRLSQGLDPATAEYTEIDDLYGRIGHYREELAKVERQKQLKRQRHVRGLIRYRAERTAFTTP